MTLKEYYAQKRTRGKSYTGGSACTMDDLYTDFIAPRLPHPETVKQWHDLLVAYLNEEDAILFVRKYESTKDKERHWDNRRGAVTRFADGFEYVFSSNFLAHDIFLMACDGFVPTLADFKETVKSRALRITSGTKVEEDIRLYLPANKTSYCYLAHIFDINGRYQRDDGSLRALSSAENAHIYPHGKAEDWTSQSDKIRKLDYSLTHEEKAIVRAHCLRFLDPMNYFVTPQTKHNRHAIPGFNRNIGEYGPLVVTVAKQYQKLFANRYSEFLTLARVGDIPTAEDAMEIDLKYDVHGFAAAAQLAKSASPAKSYAPKVQSPFEQYLLSLGKSQNTAYAYGNVIRAIEAADGVTLDANNIDKYLSRYCKDGDRYDPKEHGTKRGALAAYKRYLQS